MHHPPVQHNFNPGPGVLPKDVLRQTQKELLDFENLGVSVLEMSHRHQAYIDMSRKLERQMREVLKIPDNFRVFLTNGGATLHFSGLPFNLAGHAFGEPEGAANFLMTG